MSFADSLRRLREAAQDPPVDRQRGRGRMRIVEVEDLQQILFHFDRLDDEIRQIDYNKQKDEEMKILTKNNT